MAKPTISVVMAVHNEEEYLREAIQSVLDQTYSDFEFIIIDDSSTDHSLKIIREYEQKDRRIKVIENEISIRLPGSLNRGIKVAKGDWIARMDGDDISLPERFASQMKYLEAYPEIDILSTWIIRISPDGKRLSEWRMVEDHNLIFWRIIFSTPVYHGTAFIRKSVLLSHGMYDDDAILEDLDLWSRLAPYVKFGCVPKALYKYRDSVEARSEKARTRVPIANEIRLKFAEKILHRSIPVEVFESLALSPITIPETRISMSQALEAIDLLLDLYKAMKNQALILEDDSDLVSQELSVWIQNLLQHTDSANFGKLVPNYKKISYWRESGLPRPIKWILFLLVAPTSFFELLVSKLGLGLKENDEK